VIVVYGIILRSLLRGRRVIGLGLVAVIPALLGLAGAVGSPDDPATFGALIVEPLFLPAVAAFVTLILGTSALGDERDEGTILFLVATPLPRSRIVVAAFLATWTAAQLFLLPTAAVAVLAPGAVSAAGLVQVLVATSLVVAAYAALFVLLSLWTRRPVVVGVLYILIWESLIAGFAPSASRVSIAAYGKAIAAGGLGDAERFAVPTVAPIAAAAILVAGTVAALALGSRALRRAELP
jgi:ABC-2 type transport system permease protein